MRDPFAEHRDGSLCKACHERQTEVTGTDHDLARNRPDDGNRLRQPHAEAGLCGSRHTMHGGDGVLPFLFAGPLSADYKDASARDVLCLACHRRNNRLEAKIIEPFGKPAVGRRNLSTTRSNVSDFQNIDIFSKDVIDSDGKFCPSRMFAVTDTA